MDRLVLWHRLVPATRDEPDQEERSGAWTASVAARLRSARAEVVAVVGSSVCAELDAMDLADGIAAALACLAEAERLEPAVAASFGVAVGELESAKAGSLPFRRGGAIDRAMLLASRAKAGEIILDPSARELAARDFLFGRQLAAGIGGIRGHAIDRDHPTREACRPAIRHLRPPAIPPGIADALAPMRDGELGAGSVRVLLRGSADTGGREWIDALAAQLSPPLVLRLDGTPGSLEPLGSLRLAFLRCFRTTDLALASFKALGLMEHAIETLSRISRGIPTDRAEAVSALARLLEVVGEEERPWIVLDPLSLVDAASIDVVAEATSSGGPHCLVVARLSPDARPPAPLVKDAEVVELSLPPLRMPDARALAASMLGSATSEDVTRRVAVLGGASAIGVCEAARAMIAAGDLVWDDGAFRWRVGPRSGMSAIPVESLLEERLASLEPGPRRVLEAVCALPVGTPNALAEAVAAADGLSPGGVKSAAERLHLEAMIEGDPWQVTSKALRAVVMQGMPETRLLEVYRFVADALGAHADRGADFLQATRGYYLAESGREREGAALVIDAGKAAMLAGYTRPALKLAAAAVQVDGSPETRAAATRLSRASLAKENPIASVGEGAPLTETMIAGPEVDASATKDLARVAIEGIVSGDLEAVDRALDIAVAEGRDRAAAERLRALAHLKRGDLAEAMRALGRSREAEPGDGGLGPRGALALALVRLSAGDPHAAVRSALRALCRVRAEGHPRGEAAALHVLSICYRTIGRGEDAARLGAAATG